MNGTQDILTLLNARTKRQGGYSYAAGEGKYGLDFASERAADIDEKGMAARIWFADGNRRDGVGDLLEVGGIRTDRHIKNAVALFDHGKKVEIPIGMCLERDEAGKYDRNRYTVEIDPITKEASANVFFYQGKGLAGVDKKDEYEHAKLCEQYFHMLATGMLSGGSIGYQVIAAKQMPADYQQGKPPGLHLLAVLMLECSLVVMPANQDTVRKMLCVGNCCGKSLSPYLVKSLEPYMPEKTKTVVTKKTKTVSGYEGKANVKALEGYAYVWDITGYGPKIPGNKYGNREGFKTVRVMANSKEAAVEVALTILPENRREEPSAKQVAKQSIEGWTGPKAPDVKTLPAETETEKLPQGGDHSDTSDVPPARWKPGVGTIKGLKKLRRKYGKRMEVTFLPTQREAMQFRYQLQQSGFQVSRLAGNGGQWAVYWDRDPNIPLPEGAERFFSKSKDIKAMLDDEKALSDIRLKYRDAKGIVRRVRRSKSGSSMVHFDGKDVGAAKTMAEKRGLKFQRLGVSDSGHERVKLIGDDEGINEVAKRFGKRVKSMGTKAVGHFSRMIKPAGWTSGKEVVTFQKGDGWYWAEHGTSGPSGEKHGPFSSMEAAFADAQKQIQAYYDSYKKGKNMSKEITREVKSAPEDMPENIPTDTPEKDLDDLEETTEEKDAYDYAGEPLGAQVTRRLHKDHAMLLKDYDEAMGPLEHEPTKKYLEGKLKGWVKDLEDIESHHGKHYKDLPGLEDADGDSEGKDLDEEVETADLDDEEIETKDDEVPAEEVAEGMKEVPEEFEEGEKSLSLSEVKKKYGKKTKKKSAGEDDEETKDLDEEEEKGVCPKCGEEDCSCGKSLKRRRKDLPPEEGEQAEDAGDAFKSHEIAEVQEAAGFAKELSETDTAAFGDDHRMKSYYHSKALDLIGGAGEEEKEFAGEGVKAEPGTPEWAAEEAAEPEHKSSKRKMCKDGGAFFGEISREKAFGDAHRAKAMEWHKNLSDIAEEKAEDMVEEPPADGGPAEVPDPGEMGEKSINRVEEIFKKNVKAAEELNKKMAVLLNGNGKA